MNTKLLLATLVGTITAFLLGWLIFGMLLDPYYQANMVQVKGLYRGEADFKLYGVFLSNFCQCLLLAYVFDKWANIRTLGTGFAGGLIIAGLSTAGFDIMQWSQMNFAPYKMYAVDILVSAVFGGVVGSVIAVVLGRWKTV
ncbi:MAG: hypothetical protein IPP69_15010 [Flavobacteriales bacterium]|nr:hypothetical protein [Flavobacteriales bacterium]